MIPANLLVITVLPVNLWWSICLTSDSNGCNSEQTLTLAMVLIASAHHIQLNLKIHKFSLSTFRFSNMALGQPYLTALTMLWTHRSFTSYIYNSNGKIAFLKASN